MKENNQAAVYYNVTHQKEVWRFVKPKRVKYKGPTFVVPVPLHHGCTMMVP